MNKTQINALQMTFFIKMYEFINKIIIFAYILPTFVKNPDQNHQLFKINVF